LLLAARLISAAARALRAHAVFCWNAPQQNCGRLAAPGHEYAVPQDTQECCPQPSGVIRQSDGIALAAF